MKSNYYESETEKRVAIVKLIELDKAKATLLYENIKDDKPYNKLISEKCRNLSYLDIPLKCLEYLWIGCKKADLKTKLKSKASYLVRINEDNHPRKHLLFSLEENMKVITEDETKVLSKLYGNSYPIDEINEESTRINTVDNPTNTAYARF